MPRSKGPPKATLSLFVKRSQFPISDCYEGKNLLLAYNFWPRRSGKSLFENKILGESWIERPMSEAQIKRRIRRRRLRRLGEADKHRILLKSNPPDGRESLTGPRKVNRAEFVPGDLARHIRASGDARDLARARQLHRIVVSSDFQHSTFLANTLIEAYGKCERIDEALEVFRQIRIPNTFSFNILIAALFQNDRVPQAATEFAGMGCRDMVTWNTMVTGYAQSGHMDSAAEVFSLMPYRGIVSWTAMVSSYAGNCRLDHARELFLAMPQRSVVSWNAMLQALAVNGHLDEARELFASMPERDVVSWTAMITAHGNSLRLNFARIYFDRMPERDTVSWNAMIDAYGENRQPDEARRMFDRMPRPDDQSWPALIKAYAVAGFVLEARIIFDKCPRKIVYAWSAMVAAYAQNKDLHRAREIFEEMPVKNSRAWNAIIAGHAQTGDLIQAEQVFSAMANPNTTSWNALIHGYGRSSRHDEAIHASRRMNLAGSSPDDVTFLGLLNSCNHAGVLETSREIFLSIREQHFQDPTVDHYCCLINALGRAGKLGQAEELMGSMPFLPDAVTWTTLLNVCKLHGDVELGSLAAKNAFELDPRCSSPYLLLADLERPPPAAAAAVAEPGFVPTSKTKEVYFGSGRKVKSYKEVKRRKQEVYSKDQRLRDLREVLKGSFWLLIYICMALEEATALLQRPRVVIQDGRSTTIT